LKKEGSFNITTRDTVSPKLPIGLITYWLVGRKMEAELTTVVTAGDDTVTNGSTLTNRK
jgi:hypothetical protein